MTELFYNQILSEDPFVKPEQTLKLYIEKRLKQTFPDKDYVCSLDWSIINYQNTYKQSKYCQGPSWVIESCYEPDPNKDCEEDCMYVLIHKIDSNNVIYDTLRFNTPIEASIALEWLIMGGY